MISEKNKQLAQWAMDFALKNGCQAAKVSISSGSHSSYEIRDTQIDKLQQASENSLTIHVYVDGRYGAYSTNRLEQNELKNFILNGISSTRYLAKDEFRVLPDPERYYQGNLPDLKLFDTSFTTINPDDKLEIARNAAAEVYGKDERIVSVETSFSDGENSDYLITSNGFEGDKSSSWYSTSASVSIKGEGDARPSSWWYDVSLYFNDLVKAGIGDKALERALKKLGQHKTKSGKYAMVIDPLNSANALYPLVNALRGNALQQKNSFLLDRLGQKIGSDKFTLIDDPHQIGKRGASYFDGEGVATERRTVFDEGVLKTYFIDTYNAKKMEVAPTISSPSILTLQQGDKNVDQLVADVHKGILVTGFNGGNCNSSTGDFSYGIEGFLIENGKITQPVSEMNITGNMLTLWANLAQVGNDPAPMSTWQIPSLVFENVDFSGL